MKIYPIFTNLVDIFTGDGWEQWSRWRLINKKHWIQIGGQKITHPALIIKHLQENLKCQLDVAG